ncbi:class I SAM-dependent methyltransferase [Fibrobacter sp.]|uniref:class I SAM-dependent methyltransferase n=1 Tax=Fibrobacter sp. TaxID=35828 RepID=UPI00387092EF
MGILQGQSLFFKPGPPAEPGKAYVPLVDFLLKEVRGESVLDIGGGRGAYALELKKAGYDTVVADINAKSLEVAVANGLKTKLLDVGESVGEKVADTVTLVEVLEHVDDPKAFLQNAILAARKRVLFTLPCTESFEELFPIGLSYAHIAVSDHLWHFSYSEMKSLLDSIGMPYRLEMGDYLFPHMSMVTLRQSMKGPLGYLAMLPLRIANRLGLVPKKYPSRFYGVIEIL